MRIRTISLLLVLMVIGVGIPNASAQMLSGIDTETGIMPFHSYHGGDIDSVNLSNGKLSVDIPLISYPQRGGKLNLSFVLHYENTGLYVAGCLPSAFSSGECAIIFPFQSGFSLQETSRPGGGANCIESSSPSVVQAFNDDPGFVVQTGIEVSFMCSASITMPDGAVHAMQPISRTAFIATDASGYRVDFLPGSSLSILPGTNHVASVITGPDGVRFPGFFTDVPFPSSTIYSEDTNGNQIISTAQEWIDTLGRIVPAPPSFQVPWPAPFAQGVSGSTTDYSGCTRSLPISGAVIWNPPGVDGGSYSLKFCFASVPEVNPGGELITFCCTAVGGTQTNTSIPPLPTIATQLQSVVLPNGSAWTFQYSTDGMGNLAQITFPTGGTLSYTWTTISRDLADIRTLPDFELVQPQAVVTRTLSSNDGTSPSGQWSYQYLRGNAERVGTSMQGNWQTIVTDPANNDTVHTFSFLGANGSFTNPTPGVYETLTQSYQGAYTSGNLLRTVQTDYKVVNGMSWPDVSSTVVPIRTTTTLDNGLQSKTEQDWDSGFPLQRDFYDSSNNFIQASCFTSFPCGNALYGQTVATREYDYGAGAPGPLLRTTSTSYVAPGNSSYLNNNLLTLPSAKSIRDSAGAVVASTSYAYDESAPLASGISTQLDLAPPAGSARGNLTSTTQMLTTPPDSCNGNAANTASITTGARWFDTGQIAKHIDPLGNVTTFGYSPVFAGGYLTQSCNALNQCVSADYDINLGLKTSFTDANHQTATYQYDNMARVTGITLPAVIVNGAAVEGSTTFTYNDIPGSISVQRTRRQDENTGITDFHLFDGLGRPVSAKLVDPQGNIFTNTGYDALGRVASVSNPYRSTADAVFGTTTTQYDALGRVSQVTHPDGTFVLNTYSGRAIQFQDEGNGSSRVTNISQVDGLGRRSSVCEVTTASQVNQDSPTACGQDIAGTGFLTTYQYDTLGNLTRVQQGNISRSFLYDSASQLVSATNPESGSVCYQYDAAGNIVTRTRPAPNQGNPQATVTTFYAYDQLHRPTSISYSDGTTPAVVKHYDSSTELGIPINNSIGRLSAEYVTTPAGQLLSGRIYSYDPLGRVIDNSQCTPQNCGTGGIFPFQYSYDLLGKPLSAGNGQGITFSYNYDAAGHLAMMTSSLADANHPGTLFSGAAYSPFESLSAASLGTAINQGLSYDKRGRVTAYTSSVIQPTASLLNNTDINAMLAGWKDLDRVKVADRSPFVRRTPLFSALFGRPVAGEIVISGNKAGGKKERGEIRTTVVSFDLFQKPFSIKVPYHQGQDALTVAGKLAKKINARQNRVIASVHEDEAIAVVHLTDRLGRSGFLISTSVVSNRHAPSITVTVPKESRFLAGHAFMPGEYNEGALRHLNGNELRSTMAERESR